MLLDKDSQAKYLVNLLQAAGHDVAFVKNVPQKAIASQLTLRFTN
jgi:hypothetical protein